MDIRDLVLAFRLFRDCPCPALTVSALLPCVLTDCPCPALTVSALLLLSVLQVAGEKDSVVSPGQGKVLLSNLSGLPSQSSRFLKLEYFYLLAVLFFGTLFQLSRCSKKCSWEMAS